MKVKKYSIAISFFISSAANAIDNPHFYRSTYFWGEPRFEEQWLTSFEASFGGASTDKSRDGRGKEAQLLDIYGFSAMQFLGAGVPNLDPTNPLDQLLINLAQLPKNDDFGMLSFSGHFQILEATFNAYQNLINGFFVQAYLPVRRLTISTPLFIDVSPQTGQPNRSNPVWYNFLQQFPAILARYNLALKPTQEVGCGDLSLLIGWACNYEKTEVLDFIDVDAKIGLLFPTGKKRNEDILFSLPLGYNGHYGVPLKFDCSFGVWDWLTFGMHLGALFFFSKKQEIRIKTAPEQQGLIKLVKTHASIDQGTIWDISAYIKADHFIKGLSLLCGYSFNKKDHDIVIPTNFTFQPSIVNNDDGFKNWQMHVIQIMAEYDFATYRSRNLPRVGFFYNIIVGGKRIFNTNVANLYCGVDLSWCY